MSKAPDTTALSTDHISGIIEMALSDHVRFSDIKTEYGVSDKDVKIIMRRELKSGSYKAWRRRVRDFSDRRDVYK
ncbi:hypothetical protein RB2150_09769 [Rhodobacterales bacterium HTCC2150]|nr:hypothetical protein RB2150_09769 [Rhodobacterales bacterium HTCC2150] [Rhodobacteraceae bacterium HTCC2150]